MFQFFTTENFCQSIVGLFQEIYWIEDHNRAFQVGHAELTTSDKHCAFRFNVTSKPLTVSPNICFQLFTTQIVFSENHWSGNSFSNRSIFFKEISKSFYHYELFDIFVHHSFQNHTYKWVADVLIKWWLVMLKYPHSYLSVHLYMSYP